VEEKKNFSIIKKIIIISGSIVILCLITVGIVFATGQQGSTIMFFKATPSPSPTVIPVPTPTQIPIKMSLNGEENVVINFKGSYIDEGVTAFYGDDDVSSDVEVISNLNTEKLGDYLIVYLYRDKTISRFIKVKDTQPPRIELLGDEDMVIKMHSEFVDPLYEVTDNYDEDLNEKVVSENNIDVKNIGKYEIVYTVTDSSGNQGRTVRTVEVVRQSPLEQGLMDFTLEGLFDNAILKETPKQGEDYIKSTAFIGDSVNLSFLWRGLIPSSQAWGRTSLTPQNIDKLEILHYRYKTQMLTVDMIKEYRPKRVIFTMGVDGIGATPPEVMAEDYRKLIKLIRKNIDVDIIINNILPLHPLHDDTELARWHPTNKKANKTNYYIAKMCSEMGVYYLDSAPILKSWKGQGDERYFAEDGYHLNTLGQTKLMDYILTHALLD
jgi:hypothetical protein